MRDRSTRPGRRALLALAVGGVALLGACGGKENGQNVFKPAGRPAHKIAGLFTPVAFVAVGVLVLVLTLLLVGVFKFRERPGHDTNVKQVHGNTPLEITWTVIPALLLAVIAVPTVSTIFSLAKKPPDALNINVVGKQWWWQFQYPDQKIVVADEFVIPVKTEVRLTLRACDPSLGTGYTGCSVIHSFWIPELAGKTDAVPGRTNHMTIEADKPGTYLGQCAQYCGLSHANMRMRVKAVSAADFQAWVASQQKGPAQPFQDAKGTPYPGAPALVSKTFGCTSCHTFDNSSKVSRGPNLTHLASRQVFASGALPLTRDNLVKWVRDAPSVLPMESRGCLLNPPTPCVGMPSFIKNLPKGQQPMTQQEAETIADYLLAQQ